MALFSECTPECVRRALDTADIVRDGDLTPIDYTGARTCVFGLRRMVDNYDFEHAWALLKTENFSQVWAYALPFASAGDSNAQCLIGFLNENGLGVAVDLDEAERWLRKAAEQNNPIAWNNLGTLLLRKGKNHNAEKCYRRAVELGFTMAAPLAE